MPEMKAILDLDDLADEWDPYEMLQTLKESDPAFKITLFAIPRRCSKAFIKKYKQHSDWIELAMHGWWHTTGETLSWTPEEAKAKMEMAEELGIDARGFKAPKWILSDVARQAAVDLGWYISDHKSARFRPTLEGERRYITDLRLRSKIDQELRLHGHTRNVSGNGIEEVFNMFVIPRGKCEYKFISEVC